jgi:hypothetical protein
VTWHGLHLSGSGQGPVVGCYENDTEYLGSTNAGNFITVCELLAFQTRLWPVQYLNSFLIFTSWSCNIYLATLLRNVISAVSALWLCFLDNLHVSVLFVNVG